MTSDAGLKRAVAAELASDPAATATVEEVRDGIVVLAAPPHGALPWAARQAAWRVEGVGAVAWHGASRRAEAAPAARPGGYHRLLVPFDGSVQALRAVDEAARLAAGLGADLKLLLVFDEASHLSGFDPARVALEQIIPRARKHAAAALDDACASVRQRGVEAEAMLVDGQEIDIPDLVDAQADATSADLVVVGTHGRKGVDRFLAGSVAEGIARVSRRPVIFVHAT